MPTLTDVCDEIVGCVSGYSCDFFTSLCRKPKEAEFCLSQDSTFGCQDGLQCTNVNLLARANSTTGNILAKFYNLPPNTMVLPNFDTLTWYFVTYVENIAYVGNGVKNLGAVYEGNLRFPLNGTWIIYVTNNSSYNLLANNVSMVTSNGNVNETSNPIYIPTSNQTNKIRLEFFDTLGNSSIKLQWLSPGVNQTRAQGLHETWLPALIVAKTLVVWLGCIASISAVWYGQILRLFCWSSHSRTYYIITSSQFRCVCVSLLFLQMLEQNRDRT